MKKSTQIALGAAVSAALMLASIPAFAAPRSLPAGDGLYAFGCEDGTEPAVGLVDVATGAVTEVVAGAAGQCYGSPAYNPADGKIYVIDWTTDYELAVFDPEAKTLSVIDAFDCEAEALAISASGNAWIHDADGGALRPVNLENATCGSGVGVVSGGSQFRGMAFAPDGALYGVNTDSGEIGTISTSDGTFTPIPTSAMLPFFNAGLTFDSSGIAWVIDDNFNAEVYSADITDYQGTKQLSGQLSFNGVDYYSEGLVVGPTSTSNDPDSKLPDTGSDSVAMGVTGLATLGVVALGAAMMIVRRRAS
jgi:LPXTG-motif cell wall-anchored protein